MKAYNNFYFENFFFEKEKMQATFVYSFDEVVFFEEKIFFSQDDFSLRQDIDMTIVENMLFHLHIALGISYYKTFLSKNLILKTWKLDEKQLSFWKKFYLHGLGEFLYKNKIDPSNLFQFSFLSEKQYHKKDFSSSEKYLVPVGWGKDSIVSIELLKQMGEKIDLVTFAQNDNILYENTSYNAGIKRLFIKRELSKNISEVNALWAYNWHVPITGMIAFVLELVSYLYDYKYIVLSNEKSANFGNTFYQGFEINHQWSKSVEFEKDFWAYVSEYISSHTKYFSLLRPYYEIKIAEFFAKFWKKYFTSFSSCNTNFKIFKTSASIQSGVKKYWCNACPKCLFVYSILRPFLTRDETLSIFWKELYEDVTLETLFRELAWISWIKPFECVGTNEEVILAMKMAYDNWQWDFPFILEIFQKEVQSKMSQQDFENIRKKVCTPDFNNHYIPEHLVWKLQKYE